MAPHLDEQQLAELRELMGPDFEGLLRAFLRDSRDRLLHLELAIKDRNWDIARRQAHSLKGSSSNLGALALAQHCQQLEQMLVQCRTEPGVAAEVPPALVRLRELLTAAQSELQKLLV